jgi:hypothetical protein
MRDLVAVDDALIGHWGQAAPAVREVPLDQQAGATIGNVGESGK